MRAASAGATDVQLLTKVQDVSLIQASDGYYCRRPGIESVAPPPPSPVHTTRPVYTSVILFSRPIFPYSASAILALYF